MQPFTLGGMTEREQLEDAIAALDAQRGLMGEQVVAAALRPVRERLAAARVAASKCAWASATGTEKCRIASLVTHTTN